jgi:hypothetical protein
MDAVAALVYFEPGTTAEDVKQLLEILKQRIEEKGKGPFIDHAIVNEYDPQYGSPVWYIP